MRSAIYEGVITHRRATPAHGFQRSIAMPLLDLSEIDEVVDQHPLWSRERPNLVSFRRADFLGDPSVDLDASVRAVVERETGNRPQGPISMLAHVRTLGWLFNPIAVYFCFDRTGLEVEHAVAHVTNTPWKEQHSYVLGRPGAHAMDKAMHVSPFFGMDQTYRITYQAPGPDLRLSVAVSQDDAQVFSAGLQLRRRPIDRRSLGRMIWRHPGLTMRVSAGIHTNALRLWRKGATFHPHPSTATQEVSDARSTHRAERVDQAA